MLTMFTMAGMQGRPPMFCHKAPGGVTRGASTKPTARKGPSHSCFISIFGSHRVTLTALMMAFMRGRPGMFCLKAPGEETRRTPTNPMARKGASSSY
jgi:hypothetical protein